MTTKKLPFELTEDSTTDWLHSLSQQNSVSSANQLNKAIKQLRLINKDDENLFDILILLTPTALFLNSTIESSLLAETKKQSSEKPHKIEKLCIQLLRNLSLAFCNFAEEESISYEKLNLAAYVALHLNAYTQRLCSIYHQYPSTTLWGKTGKLYTLAVERNIFQQEIKHEIKGLEDQSTIEAILKQNLLFTILSSYSYPSSEIIELFSISKSYAHLLNLNTENTTKHVFTWDPTSDTLPCTANITQPKNNLSINIDTNKFLSLIQSSAFSSSLAKESLKHIIDQLSGYTEIINSSIPSPVPIINHLIIGITEITTFLDKVNQLNKIQQLSSEIDNTSTRKMTLEPMEFEKNYLRPAPVIDSLSNRDSLLANIKAVKILEPKNNKYLIAETNPIDCAIGDITLLSTTKIKFIPGIIRQIKTTNQSGTTHILIEKISGTPSSHLIKTPATQKNQIIISYNEDSKPELFIAPCKFSNGTQLTLSTEDKLRLNELSDYSPFFMRYSIN